MQTVIRCEIWSGPDRSVVSMSVEEHSTDSGTNRNRCQAEVLRQPSASMSAHIPLIHQSLRRGDRAVTEIYVWLCVSMHGIVVRGIASGHRTKAQSVWTERPALISQARFSGCVANPLSASVGALTRTMMLILWPAGNLCPSHTDSGAS